MSLGNPSHSLFAELLGKAKKRQESSAQDVQPHQGESIENLNTDTDKTALVDSTAEVTTEASTVNSSQSIPLEEPLIDILQNLTPCHTPEETSMVHPLELFKPGIPDSGENRSNFFDIFDRRPQNLDECISLQNDTQQTNNLFDTKRSMQEELRNTTPYPSQIIPSVIHNMLEEVRIDIERFYLPVEHMTISIVEHVLGTMSKIFQQMKHNRPIHQLRFLSCIMGLETLLQWFQRLDPSRIQEWAKECILKRRCGVSGPTGPLLITTTNFTQVVATIQVFTRSETVSPERKELVNMQSIRPNQAPYVGEIGYNEYLHQVYTPQNTFSKKPPQTKNQPTHDIRVHGLHLLLSEKIYKHEFRPVVKRIPQFSLKKSSQGVPSTSTHHKRSVKKR